MRNHSILLKTWHMLKIMVSCYHDFLLSLSMCALYHRAASCAGAPDVTLSADITTCSAGDKLVLSGIVTASANDNDDDLSLGAEGLTPHFLNIPKTFSTYLSTSDDLGIPKKFFFRIIDGFVCIFKEVLFHFLYTSSAVQTDHVSIPVLKIL